jgi:hypothetical protein
MPVNGIIHEKNRIEQAASRVQTRHLAYKSGIWRTKLAFRLQILTFQSSNKHIVLQTGTSDYNSAYNSAAYKYGGSEMVSKWIENGFLNGVV